MKKIGITGGIGSGKTTVCRVFETLGIPVFYADVVAKNIMVTDPLLIEGIKKAFGEESYLEHQVLNKTHIAQIVFNNAAELEKLNALVHPAVFRAFDHWVAHVPASRPYILKEAALLFESGSYKMCDETIVVVAPTALKKARVMLRDEVTDVQVQARMDKQFPDEQKIEMADFLLHNQESSSIILQVLALHEQFIK